MTLYLWDASHYDGLLSRAILARAKAEGISGFTHKIAEGLSDTEGTRDDTALAAARDVGIEFLGGYGVPRTGSVPAQVDYLIRLADSGESWWRDYPGWFFQVDLERWPYDNVSATTGIDYARRLRDKTGRQVILYASHSQYGDQLAGWDGPLWNADYVSRPAAGAVAMYPGDNWRPQHKGWIGGWAPYSGRTPTILQYTSSATIAGLTTCDANAFPGTRNQFMALIRPGGTPAQLTTEDDMPLLLRVNETGACWVSDGPTRAGVASMEHLNELRAAYPGVALRSIPQALLSAHGVDIGAPEDHTFTLSPEQMAQLQTVTAEESAAVTKAAAAGVMAAMPSVVDTLVARLPAEAMTREDVEQAVRDAFSGGLAPDAAGA